MNSSQFPGVMDGLPRLPKRRRTRRFDTGGPAIISGERDFTPNPAAGEAAYLPEHLYFSPFRFTSQGPAATPNVPGTGSVTPPSDPLSGLPIFSGDAGTEGGGGTGTPGGMGEPGGQEAVAEAASQSVNAAPGSVAAGVQSTIGTVAESIASAIAAIANEVGIGPGNVSTDSPVAADTSPGAAQAAAEATAAAANAQAQAAGVSVGQANTGISGDPDAAGQTPGPAPSDPGPDAGTTGEDAGVGDGTGGDWAHGGRVDHRLHDLGPIRDRYARGGQVDWVRELVLGPGHQEGGYVRQGHRVDIRGNAVHMNTGGLPPMPAGAPRRSQLAMQMYNDARSGLNRPPTPAGGAAPTDQMMQARQQLLANHGPMAGLPNLKGLPMPGRPGMQRPMPPRQLGAVPPAGLPKMARPAGGVASMRAPGQFSQMPGAPNPQRMMQARAGLPQTFDEGGRPFTPIQDPLKAGVNPEHMFFGQAGAPGGAQSPGTTSPTPQMGGALTAGQQFDPANLPPIPEQGFPDVQTKLNWAKAYGQHGQPFPEAAPASTPAGAQPQMQRSMMDPNTGLDLPTANILAGLPDILNQRLRQVSSPGGLPSLEDMAGKRRGGRIRRRY